MVLKDRQFGVGCHFSIPGVTGFDLPSVARRNRVSLLAFLFQGNLSIFFAGTPMTVQFAGASFKTTAPAPTIEPSPTTARGSTTAPIPICAKSPILAAPPSTARGDRWTFAPILQSCSIIAPEFTMQLCPIAVPALITAPAMTTVPAPMLADGETIAELCTSTTGLGPRWPAI